MGKMRYRDVKASKFGWKRVAKRFGRFGWIPYDATEFITETTTDYYDQSGDWVKQEKKITSYVEMSLKRDPDWYTNLGAIFLFEFIFNLAFFFRKLIGKLIPLALAVLILGALLLGGGVPGEGMAVMNNWPVPLPTLIGAALYTYVILFLVEEITSFIGGKILK